MDSKENNLASSDQGYSDILNNPEFRMEFRRRLSATLLKVMNYEARNYEKIMLNAIAEHRRWLNELFGFNADSKLPDKLEVLILEKWFNGAQFSIADLLSMGMENTEYLSKTHSTKKIDGKLNLTIDELKLEIIKIVPTPEMWAGMKQEKKLEFKIGGRGLNSIARQFGVKGNPIVRSVYLELGRKIYGEEHECLKCVEKFEMSADELRVEILKVVPTPEMWAGMKQEKKLEFKIGGRGLVAIATRFGIHGNPIAHRSVYLKLGRKIYGEEHECLKELTLEELMIGIIKTLPTPEMWAKMTIKEKLALKIGDLGLTAIARKFGVRGNSFNQSAFLELGRKIYGEEHECLKEKEITIEELKLEILRKVPTPEMWAGMKQEKKMEFKIGGRGLVAIATRFGIHGNPIAHRSVYLELGRKIYGEEHECLQSKLTLEKLRVEIQKKVPTPEMWAGMKQEEKLEFKIGGRGLVAIATRFGIQGNPIAHRSVYLELGRKIYGGRYRCLKLKFTVETLRAEIQKKVPTPDMWAGMITKRKFKIGGMGLHAIAKKFGLKGDPVRYHSIHLELGRKIYGEEHECLKYEEKSEMSADELKTEIQKRVTSPEMWAGMQYKDRLAFKIDGMGLHAIAKKFGLKGDPVGYHSIHLELGRKIYGEEYECLKEKEITTEILKTEILKKVPTPEMWAGMKQRIKRKFKIGGMGLMAIATKFGLKGDPVVYHSDHLELGRKIYGEEHECLQSKLTVEELRVEIQKKVPTPEMWAGMKTRKKRKFKIRGMGLNAIATKFYIEGEPINYHSIHLELGRKIYGEEHECLRYEKKPELSVDELKTRIQKKVPTPEMWAGMKHKDILVFKIDWMGLMAIATKFGLKGDPVRNYPLLLELGRKIYGEEHECLKK